MANEQFSLPINGLADVMTRLTAAVDRLEEAAGAAGGGDSDVERVKALESQLATHAALNEDVARRLDATMDRLTKLLDE
jgi:hypothetical protein